ncbi:MAG: Non-specific serine/threonine protein kinase [Nocardia sp.]|uniref:DEAD/DEAH box helicase n=1 Tax=Nocardia sp. TaxID=1821 RepID=UPI00262145DD|nr:DEAD/DEAH box helicase [Nocardia sp.]MCU1644756.1 Non-specific serine/threonine protein kinase [Nocardia sp.]
MLHGLWSPGSGLVLWHDPAGDTVDADALPDPLGSIVRAVKFRHKAKVLVAGAYGPEEVQVRVHALAPEAAASVLLQELPAQAVAGDLRYLAHVVRGVERWVRAGRIVPEVRRDDGEWWVRWRLVGGQRQRAWLAELAVAMPAALQVGGRPAELLDNLTAELTDPIARLHLMPKLPALLSTAAQVPIGYSSREGTGAADDGMLDFDTPSTADTELDRARLRLQSLHVAGADRGGSRPHRQPPSPEAAATDGPQPRSHPLLIALLDAEPLDAGSHRVSAVLEDWRTSLTADEPELVLRLLEPDSEDAVEAGALWRLEVCLRVEGEAPQPVLLPGDPHMVRLAGEKLAAAKLAYPRLRDLPGDARSMDLYLPTEVVMDLVAHGAGVLQSAGVRLLLPRAWRIAAPSLRLQVQSPAATESAVGLDGLVSFRWELALGDTTLTPAEMTRLVRSKSDLVQLRGEWVQADHRTLAVAADYVSGHTDGTETSVGALFAELAAHPAIGVPLEQISATGWAAELFDGEHTTAPVSEPIGLKATLRPYQLRGLAWLATMSRLGCGAILADDMGLGKTVQVLALLVHERETASAAASSGAFEAVETATIAGAGAAVDAVAEGGGSAAGPGVGPTLLVCPMSVVGNWQRETERFAPDLRVLVHHGPGRRSGAEFDAAVADSDLVVTTYALLARDVEELKRQRWQRVALDEAQHIKNAGTRQARAARLVPARHRLALTGTPVENRLEELRSIMDFANPKLLGKASEFHARFAVPIERERDENAVARLRAITSPFVLRRVKTDPAVISDLPDKIEITMRANLTVEQAALYQAVLDDMSAKLKSAEGMERKGAVLAALTRLKQVCNHPAHYLKDGSAVLKRGHHRSGKLALVEDILESVIADGERALLFTQFAEFGDLVSPYLSERFGTEVPFLHGGVSKQRRDAMVTGFQEDENGPPLMLLSLKAGGTGLNLTAANHVVHLDRWWNPAVENQATDRAFRIGQRRDVQVRKLVCVDTIEERVDDMLNGKRQLADLTVGAGEKWITELGDEELRELFALGAEAVGE